MPDLLDETPEEKAFFDSDGEAAPEPSTPDTSPDEKPEPSPDVKPEEEKPEASSDDKAEEKPDEKPEKTVPYGALHEERMMRKETQQELGQVREELKQLGSLRDELEAYRKEKTDTDTKAEYEEDPIGYLRKQTEAIQTEMAQRDAQSTQQTEEMQRLQAVQTEVAAQVQQFSNEHPDYQTALGHLLEQRKADLTAVGVIDPTEQLQILNAESWNLAQTALQNHRNPAEVVYQLAQQRGYKLTEEKPEIDQKADTIEKGQKAAQTLSDAGGANSADGISLADIESMSDDEFDKLWEKIEHAS